MGAVVRPAVMNRSLAALLISWSAAIPMKSMIMISATGNIPSIAAPIAAPTIAASEIGVSKTRSRPYFVDSPAVGPDAPGSAMSSPSKNTRSSACSAWSSARFRASRIVISRSCMSWSSLSSHRILDRGCVHVPVELVDRGRIRAHHRAQGRFHGLGGVFFDLVELVLAADAGVGEPVAEPRHRGGRQRRRHLLLGYIGHPVSEVVTAEAERDAFEEGRAAAVACTLQCFVEGGFHRQRVVAIDADARHAVSGGPVGNLIELHRVAGWRHLGVEVVLAHEHQRQIPECCHVGRFMEGAGIGGTVAEADYGDAVKTLALGGRRRPP